jgi:hypothetical protein
VQPFPEKAGRRWIISEAKKVRGRLLDRAEQVLESFDADREANKLLRSFGIAPESSASTPAPSPSGSSA